MGKLRKYETVTDINVYEVELTEEQITLFNKDEDSFWDTFGDELDWEFSYDKAGDPDTEYELVD